MMECEMKAAYYNTFGDIETLKVGERPLPEPADDEVRVKVLASAVNPIDWKMRKGMLKWLVKKHLPIITGADFCGVIDKAAKDTPRFKQGDVVIGQTSGLTGGASAEYCIVKQNQIILKPEKMGVEEAAGLSLAAQTSYQALIDSAYLKEGQSILIIGASGGIGQMAIQIAKAHGALVTAVCSQKNHELVKQLGADAVIDYHQTNVRETNQQYDVIYDCVGADTPKTCQRILNKTGVFLSPAPSGKTLLPLLWGILKHKLSQSPKVTIVLLKSSYSKLAALIDLVNQDKLKVIVDKIFSLDKIKQAHAYSESQRARGKIIIQIQ